MAFVPQAGTPGISGLAGSRGAFSQASRFERLSPGGSCVVPSTVGRITDRRCGWSGCGHRRGRCLGPVMSIPFLGQDTILGVGGFELAVCLVVGYFAVGPIELFKLVKQAGILAGQLKDIGLGTVTNLNQIMEEQVARAEDIASGKASPGEESYQVPYSEEDGEDEYEEVTLDEYGRMVVNNTPKPPPGEEPDLFSDWKAPPGLGFDETEPPPSPSKFAEQLSGAVNKKILEANGQVPEEATETGGNDEWGNESGPTYGAPPAYWEPEASAAAAVAAATPGKGETLANDVPAELTIDEQFERLDAIASLEQERSEYMQRLEARLDAKITSIKSELLEIVDEDFQLRRQEVDRGFQQKVEAKARAAMEAKDKEGEKVEEVAAKDDEQNPSLSMNAASNEALEEAGKLN